MSNYEIKGIEEIVATHQIVSVEVEGMSYAFATKGNKETSALDDRSISLRDVEPSISYQLQNQDREIEHINRKHKINIGIARVGELAIALDAIGTYVMAEIHNNHDASVESLLGMFAVGAVVAGELYARSENRTAERDLQVARGHRGNLSSLLRQAQPRRQPRAIGRGRRQA